MIFDWLEYLVIAESLVALHKSESGYRSASSRAYYAAFHLAAEQLEAKHQWRRQGIGEDHQELSRLLKKFGNTKKGQIGVNLERLHKIRIRADYGAEEIPNPEKVAETSILLAREVHRNLGSI